MVPELHTSRLDQPADPKVDPIVDPGHEGPTIVGDNGRPVAGGHRPRWIPVRACGGCGVVDDVFHLTVVDRLWLCRNCHRRLHFGRMTEPRPGSVGAVRPTRDGVHPALSVSETDPATANPNSIHARLARIDTVFRWITTGLRVTAYAVLFALTAAYPILENVLFGFFVADTCAWALLAWLDARFHGQAVTVEAAFYSLVFLTLYTTGRLDLPVDAAARFLAGGTAGMTLVGHAARFWHKLHFA